MSESESELLQSLDRVLEESRKIRAESVPLLENAQWPVVEPCKPAPPQEEEVKLPAFDLLLIPRPPLLGFQRDKGNLPSGPPAQLLEPNPAKRDGSPPSPSKTDKPSQDNVLEPADLPEVLVSSP